MTKIHRGQFLQGHQNSSSHSGWFRSRNASKTTDMTSRWSRLGVLREEGGWQVETIGAVSPLSRKPGAERVLFIKNDVTYLKAGHHICKSGFLKH